MRNYLKYLSDTIYLFQRKYSLTDNQLKFLLFIGDEKGSFTKRFIKESIYVSKNFKFWSTTKIITKWVNTMTNSISNTFIHEILHAIIYQWGIDLDEKEEERICNILANGLTTVIVDNSWLLPYLQKHIGEKNGNNV